MFQILHSFIYEVSYTMIKKKGTFFLNNHILNNDI